MSARPSRPSLAARLRRAAPVAALAALSALCGSPVAAAPAGRVLAPRPVPMVAALPPAPAASDLAKRYDLALDGQPVAVATVDLNGDGVLDLVVLIDQGWVSVRLGLGGAAFGAPTRYLVSGGPSALAVGDVNGDGKPDLVVCAMPKNLSVLPGNGDGTFGTRVDLVTGYAPNGVALGDVNGDGRADLVTANTLSSSLSVFPGLAGGGFAARQDVRIGGPVVAVAIADLDGDGRADLIAANPTDDVVSVRLGTGGGAFAPQTDYVAMLKPVALAVGDLNGDGARDVVVADAANGDVSVMWGDGLGDLTARTDLPAGTQAAAVALADLDGDGRLDVVVSDPAAGRVGTLVNGGAGGFVAHHYTAAPGAGPLAVGDLDGDGLRDVAVGDVIPGGNGVGLVSVLTWASATTTTLVSSPNPSAVGQPVQLASTVAPSSATGSVTFLDGASALGTVTLVGAQASLMVSSLGLGTHHLTAVYSGNTQYGTSTSPEVLHAVGLALTTTNLTSSPNPSLPLQSVSLQASVVPSSASGSVGFYDGPVRLAASALSAGVATAAIRFTAIGTHALTARYLGNTTFSASQSAAVQQVVQAGASTTTLLSGINPSVGGQAVLFTATVVPGQASGTVELRDGGVTIGAGTLAGGVVRWNLANLVPGTHPLVAAYLGDSTYAPSQSAPLAQVVAPAATTVALAVTPNPLRLGASGHLGATVSVVPPGTGVPAGTVQFRVDGAEFGAPVALTAGAASSADLNALARGAHAAQAVYSGSASHAGSASAVLALRVVQLEPAIVSIRDVPQDQGHHVRLALGPSDADAPGAAAPVVRYDVFRRIDAAATAAPPAAAAPGAAAMAGWEAVATLGAYAESVYFVVAPTLADSNAAGIHRATYFVRAATAAPAVYFDSAPDSGYSKDDLPPASPAPFVAAYDAGATHLHWGANAEPDLWYYRVYRGDTPDFAPDFPHAIATRSDTGYVDPGPPGRCYKLSAVDVNGNEGGFASVVAVAPTEAAPAFALAPPHPNPAVGGRLSVRFALADVAPARLELLDVGGRRVASLDAGALGAGWHVVDLGAGARLAPGLYVVRLSQGANVVSRRAVVLE